MKNVGRYWTLLKKKQNKFGNFNKLLYFHTSLKQSNMNLYQKLHDIQKQVIGLAKDKNGNNYQYVTGTKVLEFIKPLMNKHGIILKQEVLSIENTRQDYATKTNPNKSEILSKVMQKFTWVDCETGEKDENLFGANGQNDWDKGVGSALTYAERYFLLKYFHIATDEDDIDNPERKEEERKEMEKQVDQSIRNINVSKSKADLTKTWGKIPAHIRALDSVIDACKSKGAEFEQPVEVTTPEQALHMINEATTVEGIGQIFKALPKELQKNKEVIQFCSDKKKELLNNKTTA